MLKMHQRTVVFLIAGLLAAAQAAADLTLIDRLGSIFDDVARGFTFLGEKAQDLVGPGLGIGDPDAAAFSHSRIYDEKYPVTSAATLSAFNEFGEIRVQTWDNPIIHVHADITANAETSDFAAELCKAVEVSVAASDSHVSVRTILPPPPGDMVNSVVQVNYLLTIPRDANIICENSFGDTFVSDVHGSLAIDANYGVVEITNAHASCTVRARGEFPVRVDGLYKGGAFHLDGAPASFNHVSGELNVGNFRGSLDVRNIARDAALDLATENGDITLHLTDVDPPDLVATVLFGSIDSDFPLDRTAQGRFLVARSPNLEASQRIALRASCGNIALRRDTASSSSAPIPVDDRSQPFKENQVVEHPIDPAAAIRVDAMPGNIHIVGIDEDVLRVTATKLVRVPSSEHARDALQALVLTTQETPEGYLIQTSASPGINDTGCTSYRIDLEIQVPRTAPLDIAASHGATNVADTGGPLSVHNTSGAIHVQHAKGPLELLNENGDITAENCAGPVRASSQFGTLTLTEIFDKIEAYSTQGKTIIESPRGPIKLRSFGGPTRADARIMPLDGVYGDYDVEIEAGDFAILIPPAADVSLTLIAENGAIRSAIPITGTIQKDYQKFIGTLKNGKYAIDVTTKDGNLVVD